MRRRILAALVALGVAVGMVGAFAPAASATPNPPYGAWLNTGDLWPTSHQLHCWVTVSQGMTNGHPYAKIKRNPPIGINGGYTPTCNPGEPTTDCGLTVTPVTSGLCFLTLEIVYRTGPTTYGSAFVHLSQSPSDYNWVQVVAPVSASFVDTRIYVNAFANAYPSTDPMTNINYYPSLIRLAAWFNAS